MPGVKNFLKKLFKKNKKRLSDKARTKAWKESDEYKRLLDDHKIKNQKRSVWANKGTKKEKLIWVDDVPKETARFHRIRKYNQRQVEHNVKPYKKPRKNKKRMGGAVGPNGVL